MSNPRPRESVQAAPLILPLDRGDSLEAASDANWAIPNGLTAKERLAQIVRTTARQYGDDFGGVRDAPGRATAVRVRCPDL